MDKDFVKVNEDGVVLFREILRVLNVYYNFTASGDKSKVAVFREKFEKIGGGELYLKRFNNYEYLVQAILDGESETWIHIDGIAEERTKAPENHPVHKIVCVEDIYNKSVSENFYSEKNKEFEEFLESPPSVLPIP